MERRAFLTAAAAIPILTGAGQAAPIDPIRGMVDQLKSYVDYLNNYPGDVPDSSPVWGDLDKVEDQISQSRAVSLDGVLAQLEYAVVADTELRGESTLDADLFGNMQASLKALAT